MPLIFHQNMFSFGGHSAVRNATFTGAFAAIQGITGAIYRAAGFTEVINAGAGLRHTLSLLAHALDPNMTDLVVIEVGTTAVGVRREFIGIAWDPAALIVQHAGSVLWDSANQRWRAHNAVAAGIVNQTINRPAGLMLGADSRGLAYIAALRLGNPFLIGFMHNMYNLGDKSSAFTHLGNMADAACNAAGGVYGGAEIMIGGDFNLRPRQPKRPRGANVLLRTCAARGPGGA